jgi:DNA-binding CsgD family transcriptional regulator
VVGAVLPGEVSALYEELVRTGRLEPDRSDPRITELVRLGMATESAGQLLPVAPVAVLGDLIVGECQRIIQRQHELRSVLVDLDRLRELTIRTNGGTHGQVGVLAPGAVRTAVSTLATEATNELVDLMPSARPADPWACALEPVTVRHRILCQRDAARPGQRIRVLESVPVFVRVADESTLLVADRDGGLIVRSTWLAMGIRMLFDLLWDGASTSMPTGLTPARWRVLRLLATGMDDAAVASATGTSIRTVRAHVATLMHALGARTRLAAGVEAARRGWLS